jgi:integrase
MLPIFHRDETGSAGSMKLTDATAAKLALPDGKNEAFFWDADLPGFGVRLRRIGEETTRRWYAQFRVGKQQRRESLGDVRKIKLEAARAIARQRFAKVELGQDPTADRAAAQAGAVAAKQTLGRVAELYLKTKKGELRASTFSASERYLMQHWLSLHAKPISTITRADIATVLRELIGDHGKVSAARARSNLSALFAWCIGEGMAENNPVTGTNAPDKNVKSRARILNDVELRAIWNACQDDSFGRVVRLLILNGCRRSEIGDLRWSEINFDTGQMTIPPERVKNDQPLKLTLAPASLDILRAIPRNAYRGDYVFGKRGARGFNAWSYTSMALNARIVETNGKALAPWTLHDIRRSVRTGLSRIGILPHVAELTIGHAVTGITAVYDKHKYENEITQALARWADHVGAIVEGRTSNVVSLHA